MKVTNHRQAIKAIKRRLENNRQIVKDLRKLIREDEERLRNHSRSIHNIRKTAKWKHHGSKTPNIQVVEDTVNEVILPECPEICSCSSKKTTSRDGLWFT